jgi:hypothetical protein
MLSLANGDLKMGIIKEDKGDTVTIQMPAPGMAAETVKKADIKKTETGVSGMPPGLGEMLSLRELRDIVEYVANLKE